MHRKQPILTRFRTMRRRTLAILVAAALAVVAGGMAAYAQLTPPRDDQNFHTYTWHYVCKKGKTGERAKAVFVGINGKCRPGESRIAIPGGKTIDKIVADLEEKIDAVPSGENGQDGKTPVLEIRDDGHLWATFEGEAPIDLGQVVGKDGENGADGENGEDGSNGEDGDDAILSVTAVTAVSDRDDSGVHGTWAKDAYTRTVALTRQSAIKATNCGDGATECWFYTANLVDVGTFRTIEGALSPNDGAAINGVVSGQFSGGGRIEFYASSPTPDTSLVPATVEGGTPTTTNWVKEFFVDGTVVTDPELLNWQWTYSAPSTCDQWVNAFDGNSGDITGTNMCGEATE